MGENSKIEWCDHTFNPWIGCTKVSAGCANCYAEELMDKRYGKAKWGDNGTRVRTSVANWKKPLAWNRAAEKAGRRARVFCASLADVFEDREELKPWRKDLLNLICRTPHLDWLLLTKRPENITQMMWDAFHCAVGWETTPMNTVWIGTSVENQEQANKRIPELLNCRYAAKRFISCEPLLGPVDLERGGWSFLNPLRPPPGNKLGWEHGLDWVIVGGESGPGARPFNPDWARSILDQCQANGVAFFGKQWDKKQALPDDLMIREFPQPPRLRAPAGESAKEGGSQ